MGEEVSDKIDEAFGSKVSSKAFNGVNPMSPMSNGGFLFSNFIEAILPFVEGSLEEYERAQDKYIGKANKKKKVVKG